MHRDCETVIKHFLLINAEQSNVLIVQGARQVGKTYVCNSVIQQLQQITLGIDLEKSPDVKLEIDATTSFEEFTRYLKQKFGFVPGKAQLFFIDEAQESKKLGGYLRFMKEQWQHTKCIMTGSSMSKLFAENIRIPVGRVSYLTILPFSFREFLRALGREGQFAGVITGNEQPTPATHQELLRLYDDYLLVGGLPEVVFSYATGEPFVDTLKFILASQRDDFFRKERVKDYLFLDALRGIANHVGYPGLFTQIAASYHDARKITHLLREWCLVHEIEQKSLSSTSRFHPKWYIYDLGMLRLIRETAVPRISAIKTINEAQRTPLGGIIENAVLLGLLHTHGTLLPIVGWKKNHKQPIEVDFVVKTVDATIPIEVKASLKVGPKHCTGILHYLRVTGQTYGQLVSLAMPEKVNVDNCTIDCVPAYRTSSPHLLSFLVYFFFWFYFR